MLKFAILLTIFIASQAIDVIPVRDPRNITIGYGSCSDIRIEEYVTKSLEAVMDTDPDMWLWGGDVVYLDDTATTLIPKKQPCYDISDESYTKGFYDKMKNHPTYQKLLKKMPVIGVWDDHDYAFDNADGKFPYKERNKHIYLDFFDIPKDHYLRKRDGVYNSFYIGKDKLVKVILLDVRYNRDQEGVVSQTLDIDVTPEFDDMLGENQWKWLENELKDETPIYTLIVSGTQFFPDDRSVLDNWYTDSMNKFFNMIAESQRSGIVLVSGDVHYAEILTHPCPERVGYKNFYEISSSGLTHSATEAKGIDHVVPNTYSTHKDRYFGKNFGMIKFEFQGDDVPDLIWEIRDLEGNIVLERRIKYRDLVFDPKIVKTHSKSWNMYKWKNVLKRKAEHAGDVIKEAF